MTDAKKLKAAVEMVKANGAHVLNESKAYRQARDALLAEEIELRRLIVRVAEQRRALPPGGEVMKDYRFDGKDGAVGFAELFGDRDTFSDLQLHVRAAAPNRMPHVYVADERLGWHCAACQATRGVCDDGPLAHRAHPGLLQRARLGEPSALR